MTADVMSEWSNEPHDYDPDLTRLEPLGAALAWPGMSEPTPRPPQHPCRVCDRFKGSYLHKKPDMLADNG